MKHLIKTLYKNTSIGFFVFKPIILIYQYFLHKKYLTAEQFVHFRFKKYFGYSLNLKNPQTLNEKINWMILFYNNPISKIIADKYAVREIVEAKIGKEFLIPLLYKTNNPKDINLNNLPDLPCIIKTNHDSSGGIIIRNKKNIENWNKIQNILRANLAQNFYWNIREKHYKNIPRKIIVEELLLDENMGIPNDYKVHCFNGKVRMINVDVNRGTLNHCRNWYSRNWKREPYTWSTPLANGLYTDPSEHDIPKPILLDKMIILSEKLAEGFPYIRVDWYINKNNLYFGELTLHNAGGKRAIKPKEWDKKLGEELILEMNN